MENYAVFKNPDVLLSWMGICDILLNQGKMTEK